MILCQALHDHDMMSDLGAQGRYLERSSTLMREHINTPPPNRNRIEYGVLKRVFTDKGTKYMNIVDIEAAGTFLRLSDQTYCDMGFHSLVFKEVIHSLLHECCFHTLQHVLC
jgi:hypothetical protein